MAVRQFLHRKSEELRDSDVLAITTTLVIAMIAMTIVIGIGFAIAFWQVP